MSVCGIPLCPVNHCSSTEVVPIAINTTLLLSSYTLHFSVAKQKDRCRCVASRCVRQITAVLQKQFLQPLTLLYYCPRIHYITLHTFLTTRFFHSHTSNTNRNLILKGLKQDNGHLQSNVQGVQLKTGPYFNMSNLFTKIYNMLYYTTKLYLQ